MPGEMLERLALAILNDDRTAGGFPSVESRENISNSDGYVRNARAVVEALMEPDERIEEAGINAFWPGPEIVYPDEHEGPDAAIKASWQAMLRAVLE